jgi:hypothetical protein
MLYITIQRNCSASSYPVCVENLVGKPERKYPAGRYTHSWGTLLKWTLKERCEDVDRIPSLNTGSSSGAIVRKAMNIGEA